MKDWEGFFIHCIWNTHNHVWKTLFFSIFVFPSVGEKQILKFLELSEWVNCYLVTEKNAPLGWSHGLINFKSPKTCRQRNVFSLRKEGVLLKFFPPIYSKMKFFCFFKGKKLNQYENIENFQCWIFPLPYFSVYFFGSYLPSHGGTWFKIFLILTSY